MTDGHVAGEFVDGLLITEYIRHFTHSFVHVDRALIGSNDTGRFLTTMLQRVETEVRQLRCLGVSKDSKDAAIVVHEVIQHNFSLGAGPESAKCIAPGGECQTIWRLSDLILLEGDCTAQRKGGGSVQ